MTNTTSDSDHKEVCTQNQIPLTWDWLHDMGPTWSKTTPEGHHWEVGGEATQHRACQLHLPILVAT